MITSHNLVYSKAAAARILGVPVRAIAGFQKWFKVCWVWVRGKRPTFISFKAFKQHFVKWRKKQANSLCISKIHETHYRVVNPKKNSAYTVWLFHDGPDCECEDYKNQIAILGKGCCKHGYSVLQFLGYDRPSDYLSTD